MGIVSLTSFVDGIPELLTQFELRDTLVVIDGNNICYALYRDCGVSSVFGGDYDKFAKRSKEYFRVYKQCGIQPLIIFDGAHNERKLKTSSGRAVERQNTAKRLSRGKLSKVRGKNGILPILAMQVLHDVLKDLEIPFAQCDSEADAEIVAVANHFECPVLSLDSDFYIFNVKGGFIPLNLIDINIKYENVDDSSGYKYLECKIYRMNNFLEVFDTPHPFVLPLFGTLLGNDFVSLDTFEHFFNQIKIPKLKLRHKVGPRHEKMIGLLTWLQTQETLETAVDKILEYFKTQVRSRLRNIIKETVSGYTNIGKAENILRILNKSRNENSSSENCWMVNDEMEFPNWLHELFNQGNLPPFFLNAIIHRRVLFSMQVENQETNSSYELSKPIRKVIYGLLFLLLQNKKCNDSLILEFDRVGSHLQNVKTEPVFQIDQYGSLPDLSSIRQTEAIKFICQVLKADTSLFSNMPSNLRFVCMILRFWIYESNPRVTAIDVYCVVLCILFLSTFANKFKRTFNSVNGILREIYDRLNKKDMTKIKSVLTKFRKAPVFARNRHFNVSVVHNFTQLQTCYLYAFCLNSLLKCPFQSTSASKLFNGTFLYNLSVELQNRSSPLAHVENLLGGGETAATSLFHFVLDDLMESLPKPLTLSVQKVGSKRRAKKKKNVSSVVGDVVSVSDDSEIDDSFEVAVDCDNMFELLLQ